MKKRMRSRFATPSRRVKRRTNGYTRVTGYYGRYPPLGTELKFLDLTGSNTPVSATGNIASSSLVAVAAGTGESQRIGRKITIKSIHLRWVNNIPFTASSGATDDGVRIIVYWDKQCNGTAATVTDILETADYLSFNNLSNKNRFKILADKVTDISSQAGAGNGTTNTFAQKALTKSMHLKCNIPVEFSSTTGALTEIRSNNIGVLAISDRGILTFTWQSRVRFADS